MENDPILDSGLESGLTLSTDAKRFLFEAGRWAQFLAILGFIGAGFLAVAGIFVMVAMRGAMADSFAQLGFPAALIGVLYLILAGIYVIPSLYLYRFATKAKIAVQTTDNAELTESLGYLKSTFKFYGIMVIVFIALYFIFIAVFAITGATRFIGS